MSQQRERLKVLSAGIFSLILVLGVARFAYTPLLPLMQQQAGLGVAAAGWLAALNYAGYLSGALIASLISDLVLKDKLYRIGMVVAVLSTFIMGMTDNVAVWAFSRFIAGLSSAAGMLLGTGLILNWLIRHDHRSELGIHFAGIGLGIAGCAAAVGVMSHWLDWRAQWYAFGVMGCLLLFPALRWLPAPDTSGLTKTGQAMVDKPPSPLFMRFFMAAYFCAGFGYVVSATFIVAIVERLPGLAGQGNLFQLGPDRPPHRRTQRPDPGRHPADRRHPAAGHGRRAVRGVDRRLALRRYLHRHGQPGPDHGRALLPDPAGQDDGQDDAFLRRGPDHRPGDYRLAGHRSWWLCRRALRCLGGDGGRHAAACRAQADREARVADAGPRGLLNRRGGGIFHHSRIMCCAV